MKQSNFRPYNLNQSNRKTISIDKFLGVDLTSPIFSISNGRAIDLMDCIYKDEKIQSRNGITQILEVKPYKYIKRDFNGIVDKEHIVQTNETNINSIWAFVGEDNQQHIIAHIGKLLYEIKQLENDEEITATPISTLPISGMGYKSCFEFENFKSMAFVSGKKLWFLGGNKYMVISFKNSVLNIVPVEDSDLVPIPTTTILITYQDAISNSRAGLDKVNLLTKWRKNMLLSGIGKLKDSQTTKYYDYTLDAPLISKNEDELKKDMSKFEMIIEERGVL